MSAYVLTSLRRRTSSQREGEKDILVIRWLPLLWELLQDPPESSHGLSDITLLVLGDSSLDMGKDESII
jgi:hypothetical protein